MNRPNMGATWRRSQGVRARDGGAEGRGDTPGQGRAAGYCEPNHPVRGGEEGEEADGAVDEGPQHAVSGEDHWLVPPVRGRAEEETRAHDHRQRKSHHELASAAAKGSACRNSERSKANGRVRHRKAYLRKPFSSMLVVHVRRNNMTRNEAKLAA